MPTNGDSSLRAATRTATLLGLVLLVVVLAGWTAAHGRAELVPAWLRGMTPEAAGAFALVLVGTALPGRAGAGITLLAVPLAAFAPFGTTLAVTVLAGADLLRRSSRWRRTAEAGALLVLAAGFAATLGYLVYARAVYANGPLADLALPNALAAVLCACCVLAGFDGGLAQWVVRGSDAGAVLLRRVLPVCVGVVPVLSFFLIRSQRAGHIGEQAAVAARMGGTITLFCLALGYTARELRRSDDRRARTAFALESVGDDLDRRVREQAEEIVAERSLAAVVADRERIAADLHDLVIQRLFAVALDLQSRASEGGVIDVEHAVDGLDDAITDLRRSIFDLKSTPAVGLDAALREIVGGAAGAFSVSPTLTMSGSLDAVPAAIAAQVLAAAREGVSNAVRHARAARLAVGVTVEVGALALTVADDGSGFDAGTVTASGMGNLRDRAAQLGGWCTWTRGDAGGTLMTWRVPFAEHQVDARLTRTALLTASMRAVAGDLARNPGGRRLAMALTSLRALADADVGGVVLQDGEELHLIATDGFPAGSDPVGARFDMTESLSTKVIASGTPLRIDNADALPSMHAHRDLDLGPSMLVPARGAGGVHGVFVLGRTSGRAPFRQADEDAALVLATHAAALLALAPEPEGVRAWPSTEFDYSAVLRRPAPGLRPYHGLPSYTNTDS